MSVVKRTMRVCVESQRLTLPHFYDWEAIVQLSLDPTCWCSLGRVVATVGGFAMSELATHWCRGSGYEWSCF